MSLAQRVRAPIARFLRVEASSGIVLLLAAVIAMAWANSPLRESYTRLWELPMPIVFGDLAFKRPLHFWVNDGAMTLFFFLVGLELRRELSEGQLASPRLAALPVIAAVGGMVVPALIFGALNYGLPSSRGWGVPIATDIAFAIAVLTVVGKRVPAAARIFLLALAVIDDIGAIVVIAIFYATSFSLLGVVLALIAIAVVVVLRKLHVRRPFAYVVPGVVLWAGLLHAGIHPTLSGVILGMLVPVTRGEEDARSDLESVVHPWVAFVVMPLFALANAGVEIGGIPWAGGAHARVVAGVVLGLVLGKPIGILGFSALSTKLGLASRPPGLTWGALLAAGVLAGIGFTMAIFIADLAFQDPALLRVTKLAILAASTLAALLGGLAARQLRSRFAKMLQ